MKLAEYQRPAKDVANERRVERGENITPRPDENYMREVQIAKREFHKLWKENDAQKLVAAIDDAVAAELVLRDNREFDIPLDGKLYEDSDKPAIDPTTGAPGPLRIKVNPRLRGLKHGYQDQRLEARRRLYALLLKDPHPSRFYELLDAIEQHDGTDGNGQWLCGRNGFGDALPDWIEKPWGQLKRGTAKTNT